MPFYWGHSNIGYSPKPDIVLHKRKDPLFHTTDKHFERLFKTYGAPISILNLVKKGTEKERKLGFLFSRYFEKAHELGKSYFSKKDDFLYEWFDFHQLYSKDEEEVFTKVQRIGLENFNRNGITFFNFDNKAAVRKSLFFLAKRD